jgi:hypothetical protein
MDADLGDAPGDDAATDADRSDASTDDDAADATSSDATSSDATVDDAAADAGRSDATAHDAATDAGRDAPYEGGGLIPPGDASDCTRAVCEGFDDITVASTGLSPYDTWVTRLRAVLPASALAEGDLVLEAAPAQTTVSSQLNATAYDDPSYDPCSKAKSGCVASGASSETTVTGRALAAGALAFLGAALLRRRRPTRRG